MCCLVVFGLEVGMVVGFIVINNYDNEVTGNTNLWSILIAFVYE